MSDHSYAKSFCRLSVSIIALISVAVWARAVAANPCKADGQPCRTNQSCCGRVCVNSAPPGKRPFGTCCTRTTCTAAGAQCGLINDGSCPDMLNCGDCPAGQSPQLSMSGQLPSLMRPHWAPAAVHVVRVQHVPNGLLPGGALFTQTRPQQLWLVRHGCPSALHGFAATALAQTATEISAMMETDKRQNDFA